ncbi:MAG: hypothetical protein Q7T11_03910 [Deltaproteobacteria bacterium]|nr:hypothetical protein [Deltaproteobacteria bacterium]
MSCSPILKKNPEATPGVSAEGKLTPLFASGEKPTPNAHKINFVFVPVNFNDSAHLLTPDRARALASQLVVTGGDHAFLHRPVFARHADQFQFWLWEDNHPPELQRTTVGMCSGSGPIDEVDAAVEMALKAQAMGNIFFMNLLNTDCRAQGSWFEIDQLDETEAGVKKIWREAFDLNRFRELILTNPSLLEYPEKLKRAVIQSMDMALLSAKLIRRFDSPRTYLPIPEAAVAGLRDFKEEEITTLGGHEPGHLFGNWDLYSEAGKKDQMDQLAVWLQTLNTTYDLIDLLDLRDTLDEAVKLLRMSIAVPRMNINPFELLIRQPELTKALGEPLGFPHCATSPEEGRSWAKALGVPQPEGFFLERGCLYMDKALLYRSSNSIMFLSNRGDFDPIEEAWIDHQINCRLNPTEACQTPVWKSSLFD